MRTIKFRGKSLGIWVYGSLEVFSDENKQYARIKFDELYTDGDLGITIPVGHDYLVDPETVGQFIGLYDKNGKEIYEGDILQVKVRYPKETIEYIGVVEYDDIQPCFIIRKISGESYVDKEYDFIKCSMTELKVVGNIHDRKEETE